MPYQIAPCARALTACAARLARNEAGNTLAIVAAAFIPLAALIGSGIDMSRAYMAQARLQMACDAGALAGRRAMSGGVVDDAVRAEALKFFRFNFPTGSGAQPAAFGASAFEPVIGDATDASVTIRAETSIPTSVMALFGHEAIDISVDCFARQDFVNTDIVLVLDTTGSMDSNVPGGSEKKIVALRSAVLALYDELKPVQTQLDAAGLRLRYGIVPYSSAVNVGNLLRAADPSWVISDEHSYQSRRQILSDTIVTSKEATNDSFGSQYACEQWGNAASTTTGSDPRVTTSYAFARWNSNSKRCTRTVTTTRVHSEPVPTGEWAYEMVTHDVSNYVTGNSTKIPARTSGSSTWAGCVEERQTVSTITGSSGLAIPSGAHDLNIDMIPTSDKATKWAPFWPEVSYRTNGSSASAPCPLRAERLKIWSTRSSMQSYLNSLNPTGNTYHDIGMIWGARFNSPDGIFKAQSEELPCQSSDPGNSRTYCNMGVTRHIIFMTDGLLDTTSSNYTSYGLEESEGRVSGTYSTATNLDNRHRQRFKMACQAAKAKGLSVWVVAFATKLDADLTACASSPQQASTSSNSAELTARFVEIGKNIGALRLTR